MANVLAELIVKITSDLKGFKEGLGDADKGLSNLRGKIEEHRKAIGVAMLGMATAVIAGAVASVKAYADMGSAIYDMSKKTGLGTEAISELKYAAEQSGASLSSIEVAVKKMSTTIVDASEGMAEANKALGRINLTTKDLIGLKPEEQFMKIAMGIAKLGDSTLRSATAVDIFGRSGTDLLPLLSEGADGIARLRQEAHDLGIVFDEEAAASADRLGDKFTKLNKTIEGLRNEIGQELMPAMEWWVDYSQEWLAASRPVIELLLNWHTAYDKQIKQQGAWRDMMLERRKFLGGLNNEYVKSIDYLESVLKSQGLLNEQTEATIATLREEAKAHDISTTAVKSHTQMMEEEARALGGIISSTHEFIPASKELVNAYFTVGEAEKGNIETMIVWIDLQKRAAADAEALTEALTEQQRASQSLANVERISHKAEQEYYKRLAEMGPQGLLMMGPYGAFMNEYNLAFQYNLALPEMPSGFMDWYQEITGFQHGGIVTQPTLASIGEAGPEAIVPLNEGAWGDIHIHFPNQPVFFDREDTMNKFVDMIRKGIQRLDRLGYGGAYAGS